MRLLVQNDFFLQKSICVLYGFGLALAEFQYNLTVKMLCVRKHRTREPERSPRKPLGVTACKKAPTRQSMVAIYTNIAQKG